MQFHTKLTNIRKCYIGIVKQIYVDYKLKLCILIRCNDLIMLIYKT